MRKICSCVDHFIHFCQFHVLQASKKCAILLLRYRKGGCAVNPSVICLPLDKPLHYHLTGKFAAPSPDWTHQDSALTDYELIVMTQGVLYLEYNGTRYTVPTGHYLLLPPCEGQPNLRHGFQPSDCEFYWLHFATSDNLHYKTPPSYGSGFYADADQPLRLPVQDELPALDKLVILMRQMQNNVRAGYPQRALDYETSTVLWELYCQLMFRVQVKDQAQEDRPKQLYMDMLDYVHANASAGLRVADVAKHFGYNAKYLSHLFIKLGGTPLKQYILRCRMENASLLLTDTNLSIADIAQRTGYEDAHNFSRAYKKVMGVSPSDYRQAYARRLLFHH